MVAYRHGFLKGDSAGYRINYGTKLSQGTIPHHLGNAAIVFRDGGIEMLASNVTQGGQGTRFIDTHHLAIAHDISRQNCRQSPRNIPA
jgi:hypothetical protein